MSDIKELQKQLSELKEKIKDSKRVNKVEIGNRVRNLRIKDQYSQEELADFIGVTRANIANIETGKTTLTVNNLVALCGIFSVSSDHILGL